jgi:lysophospholipase L1-like esterase
MHSQRTALFFPSQETTPLRILPLGDSITWGYGSTNGSGYRAPLLTLLTTPPSPFSSPNTNITYIGTLTSGNLPPPLNANEGHVGALISQIGEYAKVPLSWHGTSKGDVVLLMAGTNDMFNANVPAAGAPEILGSLIDQIVAAWPEAAVLVATLTPSANIQTQANIEEFNDQVGGVVGERAEKGKRALMVSMADVELGDLMDGLHPNDMGYGKMADAWYAGLLEARETGWIEGVEGGGTLVGIQGWMVGLSIVCLVGVVWWSVCDVEGQGGREPEDEGVRQAEDEEAEEGGPSSRR